MPTAEPAVLICTVGGSPAPIIHGIHEHSPAHVLFVCSCSSVLSVETQILPALDFLPQWNILPLADEQDLLSCVTGIRAGLARTLENWGLSAHSALLGDFTGGTKVMSAALVMALMEYNVQFTYIGGGQRTKGGLGIVQDGEERLMQLANPWQVLAFTPIQQLADAFNVYQFHEAEKIARLIVEQGVRPRFFSTFAELAHAYALWDGFQYVDAEKLFDHVLPILEKEASPDLLAFIEKVRSNNLALKAVASDLVGFMVDRRQCPYYLQDLAANALRREEQGRYDDAVARLYSLLEKTAKTALLCNYGLDTSSLTIEELPQDFPTENRPIVSHDGTMQLPLFKAYQLLAHLKHPLGLNFMEHQSSLKVLLQTRNFSLLAHGFEPVSAESCVQLRNVVLAFLNTSKDGLTKFPNLNVDNLK